MSIRTSGKARADAIDLRAWAGAAAVGIVALVIAEFLVQLAVGARPSVGSGTALDLFMRRTAHLTLATVLIDTTLMAVLIVAFAAIRGLISQTAPGLGLIGDVIWGTGLVWIVITLVGDAMEGGAALIAASGRTDATALRTLTEGHALLFGSLGCIIIALNASCGAFAAFRGGFAPRWTGWLALIVAVLNLAAIPTTFVASDTAFFSVGGPAVTLFATAPWLAWVVLVCGSVYRSRQRKSAG